MFPYHALGPALGRCVHLSKARMEARLAQFGVTPVQTHVLLYLFHHGGQVSQGEITAFMRVKPPTANGVLDRMEEKGLVCRSVSRTDARQKLITLTEKGRSLQTLIRQVFESSERSMVRGLTPEEQQTFRELLDRLIANLEEDDGL